MPIIKGDCLDILQSIESDSIDLVYLDPPFFTQRSHSQKAKDNANEFTFDDTWDSLNDYLQYMRPRFIECHRVLKSTGSIFLHCDKNASHYLKILLDELFGMANFRNEIIWTYKRWTNSKQSLQSMHQNIFFYSKTDKYTFNTIYTDYSASTNVDQILQKRQRNAHGKSAYMTDSDGNVVLGDAKKGVPLGDVWNIPYLNPKATERVGYPTQKPILLLERIISIATDKGDTVLDPFCGSGTTLVAAHLLGRKYIGIDASEDAIHIAHERVSNPVKTTSLLLEKGEDRYLNKTDGESLILESLDAVPVQRNAGIDGFLKNDIDGTMVPIKIQKDSESLHQARHKLLNAASKRGCKFMVLVKTSEAEEQAFLENTMEQEPSVLVLEAFDLSVSKWLSKISKTFDLLAVGR